VSIVLGHAVIRYGSDSTAAAFYGCRSAARADRALEDFCSSFIFERLAGLDRDVSFRGDCRVTESPPSNSPTQSCRTRCAFLRGGDVLVCAAVREGALVGPQGWTGRDVLSADGRGPRADRGRALADPFDEHGIAVPERA
jgi:hypothetical protein